MTKQDRVRALAKHAHEVWCQTKEETIDTTIDQLSERGTPKGYEAAARVAHWYKIIQTPFEKLHYSDQERFIKQAEQYLELATRDEQGGE